LCNDWNFCAKIRTVGFWPVRNPAQHGWRFFQTSADGFYNAL